jgi:serine/threonine protein kinase
MAAAGTTLEIYKKMHANSPDTMTSVERVAELGRGGGGVVYRAIMSGRAEPVALKYLTPQTGVYQASMDEMVILNDLANCVGILRALYIVIPEKDYFEMKEKPEHAYYHKGMGTAYYLIYNIIDGSSLEQYVRNHHNKPEYNPLPIINSIANSLVCMHDKNIIHRDLKPLNIMLDAATLTSHIIDFGSACSVEQCVITASGFTPQYVAVEQGNRYTDRHNRINAIMGNKQLFKKYDVFSFGCIIYYMLTGKERFENRLWGSLIWNSNMTGLQFPAIDVSSPQYGWIQLIQDMIVGDPVERISMNVVLERLSTLPDPDISAFIHFVEPPSPIVSPATTISSGASGNTKSTSNGNTKTTQGGTRRRRAHRRHTIRHRK